MLCLSSDGLHVNKSVANQVNSALNSSDLPVLVDIGSCNLHVVHNAFGKGLQAFGQESEKLPLELFYSFKHSATRREDFKLLQISMDMEEHLFLRHISCRWLTLKPALCRIMELWGVVKKYFTSLPQSDKSVEKNDRYRGIMAMLKSPITKVQLTFLINVAPLFTDILTSLQRLVPMFVVV
jgi:hypothetical protein